MCIRDSYEAQEDNFSSKATENWMLKTESGTEVLKVTLVYPQLNDKSASSSGINSYISSYVQAMATKYIEENQEAMLKTLYDLGSDYRTNEIYISYEDLYHDDTNGILSYLTTFMVYTGGAHPVTYGYGMTLEDVYKRQVISYKQAMLEFGSDKPDLRNPLRIIDLTEFFQRCTFKPFHNKTVRAIKVHANMSKGFHEKLLKFATSIGMGGLGYLEVLEDKSYKGPIDKFIPEDMKGEIASLACLEVGDTIFFIADKEEHANLYACLLYTSCNNFIARTNVHIP